MSKIIHLTELMSTLYSSNRPKDQFSWLSRSSTSLMSSKSSSSSQALGEELPSLDTRGATELIVLLLCCFWGLGLGTSSLGEIHKWHPVKVKNTQCINFTVLINQAKVRGRVCILKLIANVISAVPYYRVSIRGRWWSSGSLAPGRPCRCWLCPPPIPSSGGPTLRGWFSGLTHSLGRYVDFFPFQMSLSCSDKKLQSISVAYPTYGAVFTNWSLMARKNPEPDNSLICFETPPSEKGVIGGAGRGVCQRQRWRGRLSWLHSVTALLSCTLLYTQSSILLPAWYYVYFQAFRLCTYRMTCFAPSIWPRSIYPDVIAGLMPDAQFILACPAGSLDFDEKLYSRRLPGTICCSILLRMSISVWLTNECTAC